MTNLFDEFRQVRSFLTADTEQTEQVEEDRNE